MCKQCRAEWGDEIYDLINDFTDRWPDAEFGPAHIVLSDFNCESVNIRWCLGLITGELQRRGLVTKPQHPDENKGVTDLKRGMLGNRPDFYADCDGEELAETATFLRERLLPLSLAWEGR